MDIIHTYATELIYRDPLAELGIELFQVFRNLEIIFKCPKARPQIEVKICPYEDSEVMTLAWKTKARIFMSIFEVKS